MNEAKTIIDSNAMEILSEFLSADVEPNGNEAYRLGVLGDDLLICNLAKRWLNPQRQTLQPDASDGEKRVFEYLSKRNFWSAQMIFELKNSTRVAERLETVFGLRESKRQNPDDFDIVSGKDKIAIEKNTVMPHNSGEPIVSLLFVNQRPVNLDLFETNGLTVYFAPESGLRLMDELKKIQPVIEQKLHEKGVYS